MQNISTYYSHFLLLTHSWNLNHWQCSPPSWKTCHVIRLVPSRSWGGLDYNALHQGKAARKSFLLPFPACSATFTSFLPSLPKSFITFEEEISWDWERICHVIPLASWIGVQNQAGICNRYWPVLESTHSHSSINQLNCVDFSFKS